MDPEQHQPSPTTTTTPSPTNAAEQITRAVMGWPGVESGHGSRGEFAFKLGGRELGHLHGDRVAHFGFGKVLWRELFAAGRITYHPVFPGREGPGARAIHTDEDVADVIALMRIGYDRIAAQLEARRAA